MEIFAGLLTPIIGQSRILYLSLLTLDDQLNAHLYQRDGDNSWTPEQSDIDELCYELAKYRNAAEILNNRNPMPPVKMKRVIRLDGCGEATIHFFRIAGHGAVILTTRSPSVLEPPECLAPALRELAVRLCQLDVERRAVHAVQDRLSSLLTRDVYQEMTRSMFVLASRYRAPVSIAILDLDNFKKLNTQLGYVQANEVIASVGRLIADSVGDDCDRVVAGRFGGDEFMFTFDADGEFARRVVGRVLEGLPCLNPNFADPGARAKLREFGGCSASVGVATCRFDVDFVGGIDADAHVKALTNRANEALTKAKERKNCIVLYEELIG